MSDFLLDLRYALRTLRANPGFTAAAVLTLALGIGANTAILSVVDGVLLRPAPFDDVDRLTMVWETDRNTGTTREPASIPDYLDFAERTRSFGALGALVAGEATFTPDQGEAQRLDAVLVTPGFLDMVGVRPLIGRGFTPEDGRPGSADVVLIGDGLWDRLFARNPAALGGPLRLDGTTYTIAGVLPAGADFGILQILDAAAYGRAFADRFRRADVQLFIPLRANPNASRDNHPIFVLGRLAPAVTLGAAQQDLDGIAADLEAAYPSNDGRGVHLEPLATVVFGRVRPALAILLGAVALVLLVACVNVANLLLARGAGRTREVAVRVALGAGRGRLARQFLVEGILLALIGGAAGVLLAGWGTRALVALAPGDVPRLDTVGVNGVVLLMTTGLSLAVGIAFGLVPAWQARRVDPQSALKGEATGSTSAGAGHRRFRTALVVSELALAVTLVVGAGLLIRSFWRLYGVDTGFRAEGVLRAQLSLPRSRYPVNFADWPNFAEIHQFNAGVLARGDALPGAVSVAVAGNHPLDAGFTSSISVPGREDEAAAWPEPSVRRVSPGYLETVQLPLRRGRDFTTFDDASAPPVALLNQAAAARYFPGREPLGQQFSLWGALRTVVGVVADERTRGLAEPPPPAVYLPLGQAPGRDGNEAILLRVRGDPAAFAPALRAAIREVDPALPVFDMESLDRTLGRSVGQQRFTMLLLGSFAATAIALALIGVHGVLSYLVARRSRELGLRLALGAAPRAVVRGVVTQGIPFIALGVGLGLAAALVAARLLRRFLFGVSAADPVTFAVVGLAVFGAALLASWIPARRAARLDPMVTLRHD